MWCWMVEIVWVWGGWMRSNRQCRGGQRLWVSWCLPSWVCVFIFFYLGLFEEWCWMVDWLNWSIFPSEKKNKVSHFYLNSSEIDTNGAICFQLLGLSREKKFVTYWDWRMVFIMRRGLCWKNDREREWKKFIGTKQ